MVHKCVSSLFDISTIIHLSNSFLLLCCLKSSKLQHVWIITPYLWAKTAQTYKKALFWALTVLISKGCYWNHPLKTIISQSLHTMMLYFNLAFKNTVELLCSYSVWKNHTEYQSWWEVGTGGRFQQTSGWQRAEEDLVPVQMVSL